MKTNVILQGDCIEQMKLLPENSVDAIVTDPPYGLEFMGKNWDYDVPSVEVWQECLRVLKPGGYLLSFAGTRTYHRLVCGIEDAGFEIRDTIMWLYGSGFPKSLNIGKQIDKMNGKLGTQGKGFVTAGNDGRKAEFKQTLALRSDYGYKYDYKSNEAKEWEGWGTALKPACEPIVVARKPLSEKNVALNVLKWGTGGINIDECRIGSELIPCSNDIRSLQKWKEQDGRNHKELVNPEPTFNQGRFPANIILDEEAGKMLDEQSGISKSQKVNSPLLNIKGNNYGRALENTDIITERGHTDKGGASRFFYCAKASKSERNLGCEDLEEQITKVTNMYEMERDNGTMRELAVKKNNHPTVKPIKLMEYLIKLVSKEGAIVLDPFIGSGTTAIACLKTNRQFIGIEKEEEYIKICKARIKPYLEQESLNDRRKTTE